MKTVLLIDGENFKNYIWRFLDCKKDEIIWHKYDFNSLFKNILKNYKINKIIFYFAKIKKHKKTEKQSMKLIENQRLLKTHLEKSGFEVIFAGRVRGYEENGRLVFKEKGVDVKMGVDMVSFSTDKKYEQIILGSSDSDLQPAINESKKRESRIIYLGFENNYNKGIYYNSHKTVLMSKSTIKKYYLK